MSGKNSFQSCLYATFRCFLRFYIFIGGTIQILFGILTTALGIICIVINQGVFAQHTILYGIGVAVTIFGLFVFFSGIGGLIGGCCKVKCCLWFFVIFCFISFTTLISISIGFSFGKDWLRSNLGTIEACEENFFNAINKPISTVEKYWCNKSAGCPCYISQSNINKWSSDTTEYNKLKANVQDYNTSPANQITNVMDYRCQDGIDNYLSSSSETVDWDSLEYYQHLYNFLEERYDCSGFCRPSYVFAFTSSNTYPPKDYPKNQGCYVYFYDQFDSFVGRVIYPFWFLTVLYAINLITSYYIICTPKRRKQFLNEGNTNLEEQFVVQTNYDYQNKPSYNCYNELSVNTTGIQQNTYSQ